MQNLQDASVVEMLKSISANQLSRFEVFELDQEKYDPFTEFGLKFRVNGTETKMMVLSTQDFKYLH
jgi:hypothetical protein